MAFACSHFGIFINRARTHFVIRTKAVHVNATVGFPDEILELIQHDVGSNNVKHFLSASFFIVKGFLFVLVRD
jgi:hypothetical protein